MPVECVWPWATYRRLHTAVDSRAAAVGRGRPAPSVRGTDRVWRGWDRVGPRAWDRVGPCGTVWDTPGTPGTLGTTGDLSRSYGEGSEGGVGYAVC